MKKATAALVLAAAIAGTLAAQSGGGIEFGLKGIFLDADSINANVSGGLPGLKPAFYHGIRYSSRILDLGFGELRMGATVFGMIEGNAQNEYYDSTIGGFFPALRIRPLSFVELGAYLGWYCGISNLCNAAGENYISAVNALDPGIEVFLRFWGFRLGGRASWLQPIIPDGIAWMKPRGFTFEIMAGKDF